MTEHEILEAITDDDYAKGVVYEEDIHYPRVLSPEKLAKYLATLT